MRTVPAKLVEFQGVVSQELIGAMCWPTVEGRGPENCGLFPLFVTFFNSMASLSHPPIYTWGQTVLFVVI